MKKNTKVVTGRVRLNNVAVDEPKTNTFDNTLNYGATILIEKGQAETIEKIATAIANATENGIEMWEGQVPKDLHICLKDGDETDREAYKNHYYIESKSKHKPQIVDKKLNELNAKEIYNGVYTRVSINCYPYFHKESGNCGIACGLLNIQKISDGEVIINRSRAIDDFDIFTEEDYDGILV